MVLLLHGAPAAAGCPVALQSLALAGKGASGHSVMYLATAAVASPAQSSARVEIRTASGSETQTLAFEPGAAGAAKLWFSRADANAVSAKILSVESADGAVTKCTGAAVAIAPPGENAIVTVYDDAQPRSGLPDEAEFQHTRKLKGSDIRTKVQPEYPEHAQETNLVGAVDVEIVIDAAGKPAYAWVRDRETTNNTTEFDQPSLYAALHSTYVPTMQDGRPIVKAYLIEYTYMLDSDMTGSPPTPRPIDEHDLCPLVISNMRVENSDTRDAKAWYSFSLDAEDAKPTSAVIGIRDSKGAVTGLAWNNFHLGTVASDPKSWYTTGTFNWDGPPITSAWVDQVTMADGKTGTCQPVIAAPENLFEATSTPRVLAGDPLPLIPVQAMRPAAFSREVWPAYPAGADGQRAAGHVNVEVIVDQSGRVREAFVTKSSGVNQLDVAALDAAEASTYKAAPAGGVTLYGFTYRFVP